MTASSPWSCYRCHRSQNRRLTSALCTVCWSDLEARGLRWCNRCKQAVHPKVYSPPNYCCRSCRHRQRIPAGYVTIAQVSRRIGYAPGWIAQRLKQGWLANEAKRGPRNMWLLPDLAEYPHWEAWRRRPTSDREAILAALRQAQRLTSAQIAGATGMERDKVQLELVSMSRAGLVRCEGKMYWRLGR